jgi:hypothetical protein
MNHFNHILFLFIVACMSSCGNALQEKEAHDIVGWWSSVSDTLKFNKNGTFAFIGHSVEGQISVSKGTWIVDSIYIILNNDSVNIDSINKHRKRIPILQKGSPEDTQLVKMTFQGKVMYVNRSVLYSTLAPTGPNIVLRRFNNELYKLQGDTLLFQLLNNGRIFNSYSRNDSVKRK